MYWELHYLTSKEMIRVNRTSEMDAVDTNAEPSSSLGKLLDVVVLDVVGGGGFIVVGVVSVKSVELVASRLLFSGRN